MTIRIGINGFGRIGRAVYRLVADRKDIQVVAVNDITAPETLVYLLKFDTIFGIFPHSTALVDGILTTANQKTKMFRENDPTKLPWKDLGVDIAIESTGKFTKRADVEKHLAAGAKKVILTVPPKDPLDAMVVIGVNDGILNKDHRLVSNASCTTNCLAPMVKVLNDNFGIERGFMTTVHSYTNDQRLSDQYHKDLRRARAANENIIPTTTGAARAVGKILPELAGKLDGTAMRIPLPDGSIVDLVSVLKKKTTAEEINRTMKTASETYLKGILQYSEDPIVSSDIIGNTHSSIFDAPFTKVIGGNYVKTVAWYDNEWGYSCRVVDLIAKLASL
ncbi:MAG: type I glyceraldehyde-3-phosphate dehydrogenase [Pseudomonadota bacterium]